MGDPSHACQRRALGKELQQGLERLIRPLSQKLNTAIREVLHPARQAEASCCCAGPLPETHPLYSALNVSMYSRHGWQPIREPRSAQH